MPEPKTINDLKIHVGETGGFVHVFLQDVDDGERLVLGDDEIIVLHKYLGEVIKEYNLDPKCQ